LFKLVTQQAVVIKDTQTLDVDDVEAILLEERPSFAAWPARVS